MDTNRLSKELREIASDKASGVSVSLIGDSLTHMEGTITGQSFTNLVS
jgi:ubiquitin-conjugating enzyme (huntingtin interacting protein 2)